MRLFDFLRLIHHPKEKNDSDQSRLNVAEEIIAQPQDIPTLDGLLESAFPVSEKWMCGQLNGGEVKRPDIQGLESSLRSMWDVLRQKLQIEDQGAVLESRRRYFGKATLINRHVACAGIDTGDATVRQQTFRLELKSQVFGGGTLLKCISPVGEIDLHDPANLDKLYDLQQKLNMPKVCVVYNPKVGKHRVTIEGDRLFDLKTTQLQEIDDLVTTTVEAADRLECDLLGRDEDARYCGIMQEG